eukprot:GHVR01035765.1.p1 GENE.GHVR01035765.1~~GHVR01035765.1.p1  ORF type:complete len:141 (-),score=12.12 GHVR01035765.1:584-1006(-)
MRDAYLWVALLLLATTECTDTTTQGYDYTGIRLHRDTTTQGRKRNLEECPQFEAALYIGGPIGESVQYGGRIILNPGLPMCIELCLESFNFDPKSDIQGFAFKTPVCSPRNVGVDMYPVESEMTLGSLNIGCPCIVSNSI